MLSGTSTNSVTDLRDVLPTTVDGDRLRRRSTDHLREKDEEGVTGTPRSSESSVGDYRSKRHPQPRGQSGGRKRENGCKGGEDRRGF